jgi:hypothetical protein
VLPLKALVVHEEEDWALIVLFVVAARQYVRRQAF